MNLTCVFFLISILFIFEVTSQEDPFPTKGVPNFVKAAHFRFLNNDLLAQISLGNDDTVDGSELEKKFINNNLGIRNAAILFGDRRGVIMESHLGRVKPESYIWIASASKWLTSATVLRLVDRGIMSINDRPQDYIDYWTSDPADPRSRITLTHLLSFTSGFVGEIPCAGWKPAGAEYNPEDCVKDAYDTLFEEEPGTFYDYNGVHMQIVLVMVMKATGKDWHEVFDENIKTPLGMGEKTKWHLPSHKNPMLAGGCTSSVRDYNLFLSSLFNGTLLSQSSFYYMFTDFTQNITFGRSPAIMSIEQEWHYALGNWIECHNQNWQPSCSNLRLFSSAGGNGFYPWIDLKNMNYGIIAQDAFGDLWAFLRIVIIVGSVILAVLILVGCYYCLKNRKIKDQPFDYKEY
jgi:CubicO group peptidase (beta-lactamase class C family)